MAVNRVKVWAAEVLTYSDLNTEFNNILTNGEDLAWPATQYKDMDGQELILDGDGDTSITADTDDQIDFRVGGVDVLSLTGAGLESRPLRDSARRAIMAAMQARTNLHRTNHIAANQVMESQSLAF